MPEGFLNRVLFLLSRYGQGFMKGAALTMLIALVGTLFGCIIGFLLGIVQAIPESKKDGIAKRIFVRIVKFICTAYVEIFRGTPMMVQSMFIFYGAAAVFDIHMNLMFAAFFIVSINTGAYMTETVRGGILSVDEGQVEGAKAIGMTHTQTMIYVILPQALRNIMPQIGNNLIINIKDTSVLNVIGVMELYGSTNGIVGTYYAFFETFSITMVIYFIMTFASSRLLRALENRMDGPADYDLATQDTLAYTSGLTRFPDKKSIKDTVAKLPSEEEIKERL